MWQSKMEVIDNPKDYTNFILGDSRAVAGFETEKLGSSYYNLALGGGTPMEGYYMLKRLIASKKPIDTVIVSYGPLHLEQSEMFWDRQVKYGFYNPDEINALVLTENKTNEAFWDYSVETSSTEEIEQKLWSAWLSYYKSPYHLRAEIGKSMFLRGYSNNKVYQDIKKSRGTYDFGLADYSDELSVEAQRETFKPSTLLVNHLEKIFELAQENNIEVLYTSLPMNHTSITQMQPKYAKQVSALEFRLKEEHPEVQFVYPSLHEYANQFFGDGSHLNKKGRTKFTLDFISGMQKAKENNLKYSDLTIE